MGNLSVKELRIGNYLTLDYKTRNELFHNQIHAQDDYFQVLGIREDGDVFLELDEENVDLRIKEIKPIPLTEDWLVKFGFEKVVENLPFLVNSVDYYLEVDDLEIYANWDAGKLISISLSNTNLKIKYAHELQNLYFALTGQELILTL